MNHIPQRLAPYVPIANLIGAATGPQVEVVLHDTSSPLHSVVYVVNGHVTGRKVGQTFEHLFSDELKERASNGDLIDNYYFKVQGRTIRSSSLLLRGEDGRVFGAICINVDVTKITDAIRDLSGNVCDIRPCHSDEYPSKVRRPHFSVLDKTKVKETFGIEVPHWYESLKNCISRL